MAILFAILLFSFLIFIHELGHFVAAKLSGVQVNEFALFMGPAILKWQWGETQYSIRCIPIGGYCAMEGEDGDSDNPRSFSRAKRWQRLVILVAGAFMNMVVGILLMIVVCMPMKQIVTPVIDNFEQFSTVNGAEGLQAGDEILEVDGYQIYVQSDFGMILSMNPSDTHDLVVERNGQKVALNDFKMEKHLYQYEDGTTAMLYGINFKVEEATFGGKLGYAWNKSLDSIRLVWLSLGMLFKGQVSVGDMSGPVGIVDSMNAMAAESESTYAAFMNMLYFGAFIAINLAVMNLLPFPALDGGRVFALVVTTAIEKITRKKLDPKYEGYIHAAGMILLLALMAIVMFNDIYKIFVR